MRWKPISLLLALGLISLISLIPSTSPAYESGTFNLYHPSGIGKGEREIVISHRFYGKVNEDPIETLLGVDLGANVGLRFRYGLLDVLKVELAYTRRRKKLSSGVGLSYTLRGVPLSAGLQLSVHSYKDYGEERKFNLLALLPLRISPIPRVALLSKARIGDNGPPP